MQPTLSDILQLTVLQSPRIIHGSPPQCSSIKIAMNGGPNNRTLFLIMAFHVNCQFPVHLDFRIWSSTVTGVYPPLIPKTSDDPVMITPSGPKDLHFLSVLEVACPEAILLDRGFPVSENSVALAALL
jgi:hypothetical protein